MNLINHDRRRVPARMSVSEPTDEGTEFNTPPLRSTLERVRLHHSLTKKPTLKYSARSARPTAKAAANPGRSRKPSRRGGGVGSISALRDDLVSVDLDYALAISDPFDVHGVGIPYPPNVPSETITVWNRSTMNGNTTAFVVFNPFLALGGSDYDCVLSTAIAYTGTTIQTSETTGVTGSYSNSPLVDADLGAAGVQFRLVSAGVRVMYSGDENNRGGRVTGFVQPHHYTLNGYSEGSLLAYPDSHTDAVERKWNTIRYFPIEESELKYSSSLSGFTNSFCMGFIASAANAQKIFHSYECYATFELIGLGLYSGVPRPFSNRALEIMSAVSSVSSGSSSNPTKGFIRGVADALGQYAYETGNYVGSIAMAGLQNLFYRQLLVRARAIEHGDL